MATATDTPPPAEKRYTEADLLAMPDDGIRRWLIDGKIVEVGGVAPENATMTIRSKYHTQVEAQIVFLLKAWLEPQPRPRGRVQTSEVGVRFPGDTETTVGIDTVYISAELAARTTANDDSAIIEGVPTLAVEYCRPRTRSRISRPRFGRTGASGSHWCGWSIRPCELSRSTARTDHRSG